MVLRVMAGIERRNETKIRTALPIAAGGLLLAIIVYTLRDNGWD